MDEPSKDEAAAAAPPAAPRSIGQRLRAGRERAGLSMAAAAEKLHLDIKVIESLEADRFAELGASVYVRGHLRRYADFVGETGAEMVESYSNRDAKASAPDLTRAPHPERRSDPRRLVTPLVGLGCAAVLLVAIWWVLTGAHTAANPPKASELQHAVPAAVAPVVGMPAEPAPATVAATVPATTSGSTETQPRRDDAPVRDTRLKLELGADSWVEVYDARGEKLFYDVASAGSIKTISGRPPLRVVLGSSAGVKVEVDGERRDIPAAAADGEGARFVVNRSGSLSRAR
jgi:cytoskeleton protein RodZ